MRRFLFPVLALILAAFAQPAHAQFDNRALSDRLDRLERDLQSVQGQMVRGGMNLSGPTVVTSPALGGGVAARPADGGVSPGMAVRLDDRVDQLEELVRQLTGKVEESSYRSQQVAKQLERMQADIDLRFKDLQGAGGTNPAAPANNAAPPAAKAGDQPGPAAGPQVLGTMPEKDMKRLMQQQPAPAPAQAPAAPKDPQAAYDAAFALAQRGDYAGAEAAFQDFLDKNPKHPQAGNAAYWLGDIAYVRKDFASAAGTFLEAYKTYPKHAKAPDMIYKAGSAFGQLGKKKEACTAFAILFKDHPTMREQVKRAAQAEKQKYDCK